MDSRAKYATRPKVLSIDSSLTNQKSVEQALTAEYELKTTASGEHCLDTLQSFAPDIILLDIDLPNSDALKVCRQIRQSVQFVHTPILFLSHMNSQNEKLKGFEAGGDDYVAKPINPSALIAKLNLSLERAQKKPKDKSEAAAYPLLDVNIETLNEYLLNLIELDNSQRLGDLMLTTLDRLGLKAALYWHASGDTYSSIGPLTDLENVLLQQATQSFPVDHSARFVWGSSSFGAIIHNMPSPKSEQFQTMRQIVTTLFKATSSKMQKLSSLSSSIVFNTDAELSSNPPFDSNSLRVHGYKLEAALDNLEHQSELHLRKITQTLQTLANDESRSDFDRQQFQRLLNQSIQTRIAIYDQCLELQSQYRQILTCLNLEIDVPEVEH